MEYILFVHQDTTDKMASDTFVDIITKKLPNIFSPKGSYYYINDFFLFFFIFYFIMRYPFSVFYL